MDRTDSIQHKDCSEIAVRSASRSAGLACHL